MPIEWGDGVWHTQGPKVVVTLKLEQLEYPMAAPHPCLWKCGVSLAEWWSLS